MVRRAVPLVPTDFRPRLEAARLDTLAFLRALDRAAVAPRALPESPLQAVFALDADCAEALWGLDQPPGTLDLRALVRDTLASLNALPQARAELRAQLSGAARTRVQTLEPAIRASLDPHEAYNDLPGHYPQIR